MNYKLTLIVLIISMYAACIWIGGQAILFSRRYRLRDKIWLRDKMAPGMAQIVAHQGRKIVVAIEGRGPLYRIVIIWPWERGPDDTRREYRYYFSRKSAQVAVQSMVNDLGGIGICHVSNWSKY